MPKQQESAIRVKALSRVCEQATGTRFTKRAHLLQKSFFICFLQLVKNQSTVHKRPKMWLEVKKPPQAERKIRWEAEIYKLSNP